MHKTNLLLIIVALVIASCAPLTLTEAPLSPATVTRVSTPTPLPPSPPTSLPTSLPATEPAPPPIYPVLEKLCPASPLVPLAELGLDSRVRLLVVPDTLETRWDENRVGVFVVAPNDPTPWRMDYLFQEGYLNSSGVSVSPNGRWLIFNRKAIGQESLVSWISSLDGQQQWPLSSMEENLSASWLDESSVMMWDAENEPRKVINPFTMEEELLTNLPKTDIIGIGAILFRDAGETWMLYQAGYDYRLFNASTQTDQQVLEWLSAVDVPFLATGISVTTDGQIAIKVVRPYGFDMSPLMRVPEVIASESYTQTMQPVFLPESILPAQPSWESTSTSAMSIYNDSEQKPNPAPQFYWFDYEQQIIKDYCFAPKGRADISPDGKFVAFTRHYLPSLQPVPKSIFILNLDTGYISQIDGYQFVGWAWADE
jgi:hypothetical protein